MLIPAHVKISSCLRSWPGRSTLFCHPNDVPFHPLKHAGILRGECYVFPPEFSAGSTFQTLEIGKLFPSRVGFSVSLLEFSRQMYGVRLFERSGYHLIKPFLFFSDCPAGLSFTRHVLSGDSRGSKNTNQQKKGIAGPNVFSCKETAAYPPMFSFCFACDSGRSQG